jgi:hypothetical protein
MHHCWNIFLLLQSLDLQLNFQDIYNMIENTYFCCHLFRGYIISDWGQYKQKITYNTQ